MYTSTRQILIVSMFPFQMNRTQWTWTNQLACVPITPASAGWSFLSILPVLIIIAAVSSTGFFAYTKFIKQRNYFQADSTEDSERSNLNDSTHGFNDTLSTLSI